MDKLPHALFCVGCNYLSMHLFQQWLVNWSFKLYYMVQVNLNNYFHTMTMTFADFSQSDYSNWVMWQICPRAGRGVCEQEYNSPRFRRCDERCAFDIDILLYIDKGVPVLSAGFQLSRSKSGYTTIFSPALHEDHDEN